MTDDEKQALIVRAAKDWKPRPEPPLAVATPFGVRVNYSRFIREVFPIQPLPEPKGVLYYNEDPGEEVGEGVADEPER